MYSLYTMYEAFDEVSCVCIRLISSFNFMTIIKRFSPQPGALDEWSGLSQTANKSTSLSLCSLLCVNLLWSTAANAHTQPSTPSAVTTWNVLALSIYIFFPLLTSPSILPIDCELRSLCTTLESIILLSNREQRMVKGRKARYKNYWNKNNFIELLLLQGGDEGSIENILQIEEKRTNKT